LTDGYFKLRVVPYEFQLEKRYLAEKTTLNCYVKAVSDHGVPMLTQSRLDTLKERFPELNIEYPFIVKAVKQDVQTGWLYYELKDIHGLNHRYYPADGEPKRSQEDIITLVLRSIEEKGTNKSHLNLECPSDLMIRESTPSIQERGEFGNENEKLEFKSSIVFTANGMPDIDRQLVAVTKAIAGMMNKVGGKILIGIRDNGSLQGIESDFARLNDSETDEFYYLPNQDGYENKIRNGVKIHLGATANSHLDIRFLTEEGKTYCEVVVKEMSRPVFFNKEKIYQRAGNTTQQLKGEDITFFMEQRILKYHASWLAKESPKDPKIIPYEKENESELSMNYKDIKSSDWKEPQKKPSTAKEEFEESFGLFYDVKAIEYLKPIIWAYLTFYENGNWSYQKQAVTDEDVLFQICVTEEMKSEKLLMAYDNGYINAVIPEEIVISNNRNRIPMPMDRRHPNGWMRTRNLINVQLAKADQNVLIAHEESKGTPYFKMIPVGNIPKSHALICEGTKVIRTFQRWKMVNMRVLTKQESEQYQLIQIPEELGLTFAGFSDRDPKAGRMIRQYKRRLLA